MNCPSKNNRTSCRLQIGHNGNHIGYRNAGKGKGMVATQQREWTSAQDDSLKPIAPPQCTRCCEMGHSRKDCTYIFEDEI